MALHGQNREVHAKGSIMCGPVSVWNPEGREHEISEMHVSVHRAGVWTCLGLHRLLTKEHSSFLKGGNGTHTQSFAFHLLYFSMPMIGLY